MDQAQITELARQVLMYMGPLIAAGALAKVGEDSLESARGLAQRTWTTLQRQFQHNEDAQAALTLYKSKPQDTGRQHIIEGEIITHVHQQPEAATELLTLVEQARRLGLLTPKVADRIHNQNIGGNAQVGVAISGDVQGGITAPNMPPKKTKS